MRKLLLPKVVLFSYLIVFQQCTNKEDTSQDSLPPNYLRVNNDSTCLQSINFNSKNFYESIFGNNFQKLTAYNDLSNIDIAISLPIASGDYFLSVGSSIKIVYYPDKHNLNDGWSSHSGMMRISKLYTDVYGRITTLEGGFNCLVKHDSDTTETRCMNNGNFQYNQ